MSCTNRIDRKFLNEVANINLKFLKTVSSDGTIEEFQRYNIIFIININSKSTA